MNCIQDYQTGLDMTALPGGLLGAAKKVEVEKYILVSLPLSQCSLGKASLWASPPMLLLLLLGNLLIAVFHFEILNILFENTHNFGRRKHGEKHPSVIFFFFISQHQLKAISGLWKITDTVFYKVAKNYETEILCQEIQLRLKIYMKINKLVWISSSYRNFFEAVFIL